MMVYRSLGGLQNQSAFCIAKGGGKVKLIIPEFLQQSEFVYSSKKYITLPVHGNFNNPPTLLINWHRRRHHTG